jgi:hypothetical protein
MSKNETLLTINPLFYDALSGEFVPFGSKTKHTLGRLAVATFQKGKEPDISPLTHVYNEHYYEIAYNPSWAEDVESRVGCFEPAEMGHPQTLLRHVLLTKGNQRLWIVDETRTNPFNSGLRITRYGTKQTEISQPMKLGSELQAAREAVTQAAQEFFTE